MILSDTKSIDFQPFAKWPFFTCIEMFAYLMIFLATPLATQDIFHTFAVENHQRT
jgi:hypothetical protein